MFRLDADAGCRIGAVRVHEQLLGEADEDHAHEDHAKHDDHDDHAKHDDHDDAETHGEFRVRYVYSCSHPDKLSRIEVLAFERFGAMQSIELTFLGPKGQSAHRLTRDKPATGL